MPDRETLNKFLVVCAITNGNLEAEISDDGMSADFHFAQAPDRVFRVILDQYGDYQLTEVTK